MFCTNCGAKNRVNVNYCSKCGEKLQLTSNESIVDKKIVSAEKEPLSQGDLFKKRNNWLGWVLVISSALGFIGIVITALDGTSANGSFTGSNSPVPYIIDMFLGVQLIRQNAEKYLNWVFIRVVLGLILWGLMSAASQEWGTMIAQILFSSYYIVLIKAPLTEKTLKIANYILLPLSIITMFF